MSPFFQVALVVLFVENVVPLVRCTGFDRSSEQDVGHMLDVREQDGENLIHNDVVAWMLTHVRIWMAGSELLLEIVVQFNPWS